MAKKSIAVVTGLVVAGAVAGGAIAGGIGIFGKTRDVEFCNETCATGGNCYACRKRRTKLVQYMKAGSLLTGGVGILGAVTHELASRRAPANDNFMETTAILLLSGATIIGLCRILTKAIKKN